ncbi:MAG TPA: helix-turn-helix transcriptional regulator [Rhizomicrobium sp.]|jgi:transcriptional regulator with XRE-family HTH domain|nr:helix-turn-helix transcriptional regulator [Rhizomicrobium sp.]
MDMRALIGDNLKRYRHRAGLTQEQLADLSGFSQFYITGLERGRRNPTLITVYELATALGVSHVDLVRPTRAWLKAQSKAVTAKRRGPKSTRRRAG